MDFDDRIAMVVENRQKHRYGYYCPGQPPAIPLRLYELEEYREKTRVYFADLRALVESAEYSSQSQRTEDRSGIWRARRLFASIGGFHKGSLDLSGRSKSRYLSLVRQLGEFTMDLLPAVKLQKSSSASEHMGNEDSDLDESPDPHSWEMLQDIWRLEHCSMGDITRLSSRLLRVLDRYPEPVFQQTFLQDLPPEIIHFIMQFCDTSDARRLGSTCGVFRTIASSYIYMVAGLTLKYNPTWKDENGKRISPYYEERRKHLNSYARSCVARFADQADFLLSRDDICDAIRELHICNAWNSRRCSRARLQMDSRAGEEIFAPMWSSMNRVFARTTSISSLHLRNIMLSHHSLRALAEMEHLHTLILHACECSAAWAMHPKLPFLPAVSNVTFEFCANTTCDDAAVELLRILPNVRVLTIEGSLKNPATLPIPFILKRCNVLCTAERVVIRGFKADHVTFLADWISTALAEVCFTHFELQTVCRIWPEDVLELVAALGGTPLHTLVLDGLEWVSPAVLECISTALPDLRVLKLAYRHNDRPLKPSAAVWPGTMKDYAASLSSFPRLQHFAWNFRLDSPTGMTHDLPFIERGAYPYGEHAVDPDDLCFTEQVGGGLPRLFAAYCPTLESLEFLASKCTFELARGDGGQLTVRCVESRHIAESLYASR